MPSAKGPRVEAFYHSRRWTRARKAAILASGGVCQRCGIRRARIVHHIVPLTEQNVDDPAISIALDNMLALCQPCHNVVHAAYDTGRRPDIVVRADGSIAEAGGGRLDPNKVHDDIARVAQAKDTPPGAPPQTGGRGRAAQELEKIYRDNFRFLYFTREKGQK